MNEPIKNPESVAANKYCDETVTHMIDIENMDDEAVVRNLRFMAYATGWRDSYDARQKEIDELHNLINRISGKLMDGEPDEALQIVDSYLMNDAAASLVIQGKGPNEVGKG